MNRLFLIYILLLLIIPSAPGCGDSSTDAASDLPAKPVVIKSSLNYTAYSFNSRFPDTASLNSFSRAYSDNYSEDVRNKILDYMRSEAAKLGENVNILDRVLSVTGCKSTGEYILPTYAERAVFENREVWILQLAYGLGVPSFGHFKCFALSLANLDTLALVQCR